MVQLTPRRGARPFVSASAAGTSFLGGRSGQLGQDADWFPVRVTERGGANLYTAGYEVWIDPARDTVEAVGRRVLTEAQPGAFLGGDPQPALPCLALARLGPGGGGRTWDLMPYPGAAGGPAPLSSSTVISCPEPLSDDCCLLYYVCETRLDCFGVPTHWSEINFAALCDGQIEGVVASFPVQCADNVSHCGNTAGGCKPRCDFPATADVLTDPDAEPECCEPTPGSVMEGSAHAGECGFFPPCVVIAGTNGTDSFAGASFEVEANVNVNAEWPFSYTAPGGDFYISGRLVLCLNTPFPGWYFAGTVHVYDPAAGGSGSGPETCGCDTTYGGCPTEADDGGQEIVDFHLGDKTETLRLTTACGTIDLEIEPCAELSGSGRPPAVEYACVASARGVFCEETVGGPYLNDPTCGGRCAEAEPDPPEPDGCCNGVGELLEGNPDLTLEIPGVTPETRLITFGGGLQPVSWYTTDNTGIGFETHVFCDENGDWFMWYNTTITPATSASCDPFGLVPFGLVFPASAMPSIGVTGDILVYL